MKPIKITMNAYGPYAGKTVVDMTKLGSNGLYLVTGNTGSGKSTVFEAICFALFGETAINTGKTDVMLKSKYAPDTSICYVEMEFEYAGKRYTVYREPAQRKGKSDGSGFTERKPVVKLTDGEGRVLATRKTDVNSEIIKIIGVDKKQYQQIAMIAQGDFRRLLDADTKTRGEILRTIFKTEKYAKLSERISRDKRAAEEDYKASKTGISRLLQTFMFSEDNPFAEEIAELAGQKEITDRERITDVCSKAYEFEEKNFTAADKEYIKSDESFRKLQSSLEAAENLYKIFCDLEKSKEELSRLSEALKGAETEYAKQKNLISKREKISADIAKTKEQIGLFDDLDRLEGQIQASRREAQTCTLNAENARRSREKLLEEISALKEKSEGLSGAQAQAEKKSAEIKNADRELGEIAKLGKELKKVIELREASQKAQEKYLLLRKNNETVQSQLREVENAFYDNQAGILASHLEEGKPCPVCGSLDHPHKAVVSGRTVTKEAVDNAAALAESARNQMTEASAEASAARTAYETEERYATERSSQYLGVDSADEAILIARDVYKERNAQITAMKNQLKMLQNDMAEKKAADERIPQLEVSAEKLSADMGNYEKKVATLSATAESLVRQSKETAEKLPATDKKAAEELLRGLVSEKQRLEADYVAAEKNYLDLKNRCGVAEGRIKGLSEQTEGKEIPDIESLRASADGAGTARKDLSEKRDRAYNNFTTDKNILGQLIDENEKGKVLDKKLSMLSMLADTAGGQLTGGNTYRISLETYVQMSYFDRILMRANSRLMKMTNGQYDMVRVTVNDGKNQVGLAINIVDHFIGETRSVKTLSGGESFMASLSLALGFSDEIQQTAGGVRLDSMFVDEGFGTLDEDSLEKAVSILSELTEDSRLVGIISHVAELKERIPRQIIVTKDRYNGSKIDIVG